MRIDRTVIDMSLSLVSSDGLSYQDLSEGYLLNNTRMAAPLRGLLGESVTIRQGEAALQQCSIAGYYVHSAM